MSASPQLPEEPVKAVGVSERTAYSPVTCAQVRKRGREGEGVTHVL